MACRDCYAKHVGKDIQEVKHEDIESGSSSGRGASYAHNYECSCSICGGTGYIVPPRPVTAGLFGGITYPPCKHCNGTGSCQTNPW